MEDDGFSTGPHEIDNLAQPCSSTLETHDDIVDDLLENFFREEQEANQKKSYTTEKHDDIIDDLLGSLFYDEQDVVDTVPPVDIDILDKGLNCKFTDMDELDQVDLDILGEGLNSKLENDVLGVLLDDECIDLPIAPTPAHPPTPPIVPMNTPVNIIPLNTPALRISTDQDFSKLSMKIPVVSASFFQSIPSVSQHYDFGVHNMYRSDLPLTRKERVARWKLKRKKRKWTQVIPAKSIRREIASQRNRVQGRFVSSSEFH